MASLPPASAPRFMWSATAACKLRLAADPSTFYQCVCFSAPPAIHDASKTGFSGNSRTSLGNFRDYFRFPPRTRHSFNAIWEEAKSPLPPGALDKGPFLLELPAGIAPDETRPIQYDADSCAAHSEELPINAAIAWILEAALGSDPAAALLPTKGIIPLLLHCSPEATNAAAIANISRPKIS